MRSIVTDRVAWSVGRSVTLVSHTKTAEPIEMPFGLWARMDPRNHVLDGVHIPMERAILGKGAPIVKYRDTLRSPVRKQCCIPLAAFCAITPSVAMSIFVIY